METNMRGNPPSNQVLPFLSFLSVHIFFIELAMAQNTTFIPVNVGLVLDLDYLEANIALSCINMALSDFYATHGDYKTRMVLITRDSKKDVVAAAAAGSLHFFSLTLISISSICLLYFLSYIAYNSFGLIIEKALIKDQALIMYHSYKTWHKV